MKKLLFPFSFAVFAGFMLFNPPRIHAGDFCCSSGASIGGACTTEYNTPGVCSLWPDGTDPYQTNCVENSLLSCLPKCDGVYCPNGSNIGDSCTNNVGNSGTCQTPIHTDPLYALACPATGLLACIGTLAPPGCCYISEEGESCLISSGPPLEIGTCTTPSTAMELTQCPSWNICTPPTTSGSFLCTCNKTSLGYYNCDIALDSCQSGLMPNVTACNPVTYLNPCNNYVDSIFSCSLPCVPGGTMEWGEYGCVPYDPNVWPPIPDDVLCLPGLLCQNAGFCMKPDGSVPLWGECIWDSECGICLTPKGCEIQLSCWKTEGNLIGVCNGPCSGEGVDDNCVGVFCSDEDGFLEIGNVRTALGCIKASDTQVLINQISTWALGIAAGAALVTIAYSGFLITTAKGDSKKVSSAKSFLSSTLFGLLVISLALVLLNFVGVNILGIDSFGFGT